MTGTTVPLIWLTLTADRPLNKTLGSFSNATVRRSRAEPGLPTGITAQLKSERSMKAEVIRSRMGFFGGVQLAIAPHIEDLISEGRMPAPARSSWAGRTAQINSAHVAASDQLLPVVPIQPVARSPARIQADRRSISIFRSVLLASLMPCHDARWSGPIASSGLLG